MSSDISPLPRDSPPKQNPNDNPIKTNDHHIKTILQQWFPRLDNELSNIFGPSLSDGGVHVFGGAIKAFFMYCLPVTLLRRRLKGNIQRSLAFATYVGGVRLVDRLIRHHCPKPEDGKPMALSNLIRKFHMMIAGAIGGGVALLVDPSIYQSTIFLYWVLVRALKCLVPSIPYGNVIVMCLSASQILTLYVRHPGELDKGYLKFLLNAGGRPLSQLNLLRDPRPPVQNTCSAVHPGKGCVEDLVTFWPQSFLRSLKLYIPVYLVMLLFSKKKNPRHFADNVLRSSTFLASYCTAAWASACFYYNFVGGPCDRFSLMAHTWFAGVPVLFERDGRRTELAAYCLTYALESLHTLALIKGIIKPNHFIQWLVLTICSAVMLHNHTEQPQILMKWLFKLGERG